MSESIAGGYHVVPLSGGKDSTALALRLKEMEPRNYIYLCTPTGNELPEMFTHWARLEELLGVPITFVRTGDLTLESLIDRFNALPNGRQRWCTRMLKIEPCLAWMKDHKPCVSYIGLRADEDEREGMYGEQATYRFPLREWGWGVDDVWSYLAERGICIPRRTDCAWCYDQRIVEWKRLYEEHPELYEKAVALEERTGRTFRSPTRDTWPAKLTELRVEFVNGRAVRGEEQYDKDKERCRACSL